MLSTPGQQDYPATYVLQVFDLRNKLIAISVPLAEVTHALPLAPCPLLLNCYSFPLTPYPLPLTPYPLLLTPCSLLLTPYPSLFTPHPILLTLYLFWQEQLALQSLRAAVLCLA